MIVVLAAAGITIVANRVCKFVIIWVERVPGLFSSGAANHIINCGHGQRLIQDYDHHTYNGAGHLIQDGRVTVKGFCPDPIIAAGGWTI